MSIRKRGNRYEVRVRIGSGQRIEKTLPVGATRQDAIALETSLRQRQIATAAGRQPSRLIDEAFDLWIETGASSLKSYKHDLSYKIDVLRGYTAGKSLDQIPDVASAITKACQAEGLTAATTNRYLAILRRAANLALRWGWTDKAIGKRIAMLPGERTRHVYLTAAQVNLLAKTAGGELGDLIRFAALTGLRRSEILRLTPASVVDGSVLLDSNTKSGKPRGVPLPPQALRIAQKRLPFTLGVSLINKQYRAARAACGLPAVRFHDLRHTYASWLMQAGAAITSVRDLLGHSSVAVTSRYSHHRRSDLVQATKGLKL